MYIVHTIQYTSCFKLNVNTSVNKLNLLKKTYTIVIEFDNKHLMITIFDSNNICYH